MMDKFVDFLEEQAQRTGLEWRLTFDTAHACGWSGDLILNPRDQHEEGLTEGIVLHANGGLAALGPEHIVAILEPRARAFLKLYPNQG